MKEIVILGHPRSGNNYLVALVSRNFFGQGRVKFESSHKLIQDIDDNKKYLYVYRNPLSVLQSVFRMRKMFNLGVDSFDKFIKTPYSKMWRRIEQKVYLYRSESYARIKESTSEGTFKSVNESPPPPPEHLCAHIVFYIDLFGKKDNVLLILYTNLIKNFEKEMERISCFLELQPFSSPFINVIKKSRFFFVRRGSRLVSK